MCRLYDALESRRSMLLPSEWIIESKTSSMKIGEPASAECRWIFGSEEGFTTLVRGRTLAEKAPIRVHYTQMGRFRVH
jgi:hypothetical protein